MANCEIYDEEQHVYYRGRIVDIADDGDYIVHYENADNSFGGSESDEEKISWRLVREVPRGQIGKNMEVAPGSFVEVLCKVSEDEPCSWWLGRVKSQRGEYFHVSYLGWDTKYDEVVERERIRPAMSVDEEGRRVEPKTRAFEKTEYPVQKSLKEWMERAESVLEKVRRDANLLSLSYRKEKGVIVGIGKREKLASASLLLEIHLKHQVELQRLRDEKEKLAQQLQEQRKKVESGYRVEFPIEKDLVGLAVGKKGANIRRVKEEAGVDVIKVNDEDEVVIIIGKDEDCVNQARAMLEFIRIDYDVPDGFSGLLIGKKGENINRLAEKSGCSRMKFKTPNVLEIVGTRSACERAKILIDADLEYMQEKRLLNDETKDIAVQLQRVMGGPQQAKGVARDVSRDKVSGESVGSPLPPRDSISRTSARRRRGRNNADMQPTQESE